MSSLVSIISLSYNHAQYVEEALRSILNQTYQHIEIIIIDDASSDDSSKIIEDFIKPHPQILFFPLKDNVGNCRAFNLGWKLAKGQYIMDFALDDVLLPDRIHQQVEAFERLSIDYGVIFSDVAFIDARGKGLGAQYKRDKEGKLLENIPEGDVYKELLEHYFISPPSMLVRREVFEHLNGYDESLAYEDFDFWVRSSRLFKYHFINEIQTLKRVLPYSHGSKFTQKKQHKMLESTLIVCEKAFHLNKSEEEDLALAKRIRFHMRQALFTENFSLVKCFYELLTKVTQTNMLDKAWKSLAMVRVPLFWLYRLFR